MACKICEESNNSYRHILALYAVMLPVDYYF